MARGPGLRQRSRRSPLLLLLLSLILLRDVGRTCWRRRRTESWRRRTWRWWFSGRSIVRRPRYSLAATTIRSLPTTSTTSSTHSSPSSTTSGSSAEKYCDLRVRVSVCLSVLSLQSRRIVDEEFADDLQYTSSSHSPLSSTAPVIRGVRTAKQRAGKNIGGLKRGF